MCVYVFEDNIGTADDLLKEIGLGSSSFLFTYVCMLFLKENICAAENMLSAMHVCIHA